MGTENSVRARKCTFNLPESLQASGHWPAESLPCKDWPDLPLSLMSDRIWAVDHGAARPTALTRTHDKTPVRSRQRFGTFPNRRYLRNDPFVPVM